MVSQYVVELLSVAAILATVILREVFGRRSAKIAASKIQLRDAEAYEGLTTIIEGLRVDTDKMYYAVKKLHEAENICNWTQADSVNLAVVEKTALREK